MNHKTETLIIRDAGNDANHADAPDVLARRYVGPVPIGQLAQAVLMRLQSRLPRVLVHRISGEEDRDPVL